MSRILRILGNTLQVKCVPQVFGPVTSVRVRLTTCPTTIRGAGDLTDGSQTAQSVVLHVLTLCILSSWCGTYGLQNIVIRIGVGDHATSAIRNRSSTVQSIKQGGSRGA